MTLHNRLLSRTSVTLERVTPQSDRAIDDGLEAGLSAAYEDERGLAVARELAGHVLSVLPAAAGVNP